MEVLFAPDWRAGVAYQELLAHALANEDVRVSFLTGYKRMLPLSRLVTQWCESHPCDLLHLHWPEAYYPKKNDLWDWFRAARFSTDLARTVRRLPLVITAHNLHAHNRGEEPFSMRNMRAAFQSAKAVIAHAKPAKEKLISTFGLDSEPVHVIPHGDLSVRMKAPFPRAEARAMLRLPDGPLCLVFGAIEPYKGIEEIIEFWNRSQPSARLIIAGKPMTESYGSSLVQSIAGTANIELRFGWLSEEQLRVWLSAVDCVLFNYRTIFTSGAASLTRSMGVPLLFPERLTTVDLGEPDPRVIRFRGFDREFLDKLAIALEGPVDYTAAKPWRDAIAWPRVAALTKQAYLSCARS